MQEARGRAFVTDNYNRNVLADRYRELLLGAIAPSQPVRAAKLER
jgi:hypothetical protein